jgi:drug/metabolite transporter (DMT)-like permease
MPSTTPAAPISRSAGIATIVLTLLGWSSIPLFLKHFSTLIDPWTANGWRYGFSALVWLPVIFWHYSRSSFPTGLWRRALVPSIFNGLGQIAFGIVPYLIEPGLMTFSLRVQIVFVTIGAAVFFLAERRVIRSPLFLFGLVTVLVGTLCAIAFSPAGLGGAKSIGLSPELARHAKTIGVCLAIGSGLLYGGYSLGVRHYLHGVAPLTAFAAVSQLTAVIVIAPMFFLGEQAGFAIFNHLGRDQFVLLLISSLIGIGIGHTLYFFSIARIGVAAASGVVQLQPIVVSLISIRLFGEHLTTLQWIAGTGAVVGAAVMLYAQHRAMTVTDPLPARED